jgi:hypothetical protein
MPKPVRSRIRWGDRSISWKIAERALTRFGGKAARPRGGVGGARQRLRQRPVGGQQALAGIAEGHDL